MSPGLSFRMALVSSSYLRFSRRITSDAAFNSRHTLSRIEVISWSVTSVSISVAKAGVTTGMPPGAMDNIILKVIPKGISAAENMLRSMIVRTNVLASSAVCITV